LVVKFVQLKNILSTKDDIIIEFVPPCSSSELGARELGDWAQVKAVNDKSDNIKQEPNSSSSDSWGGWHILENSHGGLRRLADEVRG
jgi:hypothetical protein